MGGHSMSDQKVFLATSVSARALLLNQSGHICAYFREVGWAMPYSLSHSYFHTHTDGQTPRKE